MKSRLICVLLISFGLTHLTLAQPVVFNDANLKAAVKDALGIATDPTEADMLALTDLNANYLGISDLTGLEAAQNLEWLNLHDNNISDISALSELSNIEFIFFGKNNISDISALSALMSLEVLDLSNNSISDISALSGLTNLNYLDLGFNNINDISALSGLRNIEKLYLHENNISDIVALSVMTKLQWLELRNNFLDCDAYRTYIPVIQNNNPSLVYFAYDPKTFTCPPHVSTYAAQQVTGTSALLRGYLLDGDGEACEGRFRYWIQGQQNATEKSTAWQPITDNFSETVKQLLPGTIYEFLIEARNSAGVGMGYQRTFITFGDTNLGSGPLSLLSHLVHAYDFEDGTANDRVGDANGILMGGAAIVDGSLVIDHQDEYLSLPGDLIAINTYDEVTLEAWYIPEANANPDWTILAYFGDSVNGLAANALSMSAARVDNVSRAWISVGNLSAPWDAETGANGPEYDDGLLHHMVATFDANAVALYLDGVLTQRTPMAPHNSLSGISNRLAYLAKSGYDVDSEWIGSIDEFNIYNRALDANDVRYLYDARILSLAHAYPFADGTAHDRVGLAHGTLQGGAAIVDGALLTIAQDQWLSLPGDIIDINSYDAVTLEAWYTPQANANPDWTILAYFGDSVNGLGANALSISAARVDDVSRAWISVDNVTSPWEAETGANGPEYDDGLLHHMVATFDANAVALYLDGVLTQSTLTAEYNRISGISNNLAYLAKSGYAVDAEWIGKIHEFNIYKRTLTKEEIADLFARGPH